MRRRYAGRDDGAAFDPADGRWRRIAPAPVAVGIAAASVWTGSRLFVLGGQPLSEKRTLERASLYDLGSDRWAVTAAAPFGTGLRQPTAVQAGRLVVVAGVEGSRVEVASYDPATGRWRRLPGAHRALQYDATPVWTGRELLALAIDGALLSFAPRLRDRKHQVRSVQYCLPGQPRGRPSRTLQEPAHRSNQARRRLGWGRPVRPWPSPAVPRPGSPSAWRIRARVARPVASVRPRLPGR